jgi:hypothetical protein
MAFNIPNVYKIYRHLPLQDSPKFTQTVFFGLKIYHLATLVWYPPSKISIFRCTWGRVFLHAPRGLLWNPHVLAFSPWGRGWSLGVAFPLVVNSLTTEPFILEEKYHLK